MLGIAMSISISVCFSKVIAASNAYGLPLETKNTWARDDPAILVLIGACLCGMSEFCSFGRFSLNVSQVSAVIWGVVYSYSFQGYITLAFTMILRDFLLSGIIVATIIWYSCIANIRRRN